MSQPSKKNVTAVKKPRASTPATMSASPAPSSSSNVKPSTALQRTGPTQRPSRGPLPSINYHKAAGEQLSNLFPSLKDKEKGYLTRRVHAKYPHGSTGRKIYNHVRGAAKIALALAPHALKLAPLLLAAHPATQQNAISNGDVQSVQEARAAFTLTGPVQYSSSGLQNASPISYSNPFEGSGVIGMNSFEPKSKNGLVSGARIRGVDKVLDVPGYDQINTVQWVEGDLVVSIDLNPTGNTFQGTAIYQQVSVYNRYRVNNMVFFYVPNVPTTTSGGLIMSITPDPDSQYTGTGILGAQLAMAVDGADPFSVFQCGVVAWAGDKKQKFYARPDGTDPRFTSPGILNVICNSAVLPPGATTADYISQLGSIYCMYDIEVSERSLEDSNRIQQLIAISTNGFTPSLPFGSVSTEPNGFTPSNVRGFSGTTGAQYPFLNFLVNNPPGIGYGGPMGSLARAVQYGSVGGLATLAGFPVGFYLIATYYTGTVITNVTPVAINSGDTYYTVIQGISTFPAAATNATGFSLLYVSKQCDNSESYLRISITATTSTSAAFFVARICDADAYNTVAPSVLALTQLQNEMNEMREKMGLPSKSLLPTGSGRREPRGHGAKIRFPDVQPLSDLNEELSDDLPECGSLVPLDQVIGFGAIGPVSQEKKVWHVRNKEQIENLLIKGKLRAQELAAVVYSTTVYSSLDRKESGHKLVVLVPSSLVSTVDTHFVHTTNYEAACRFMPSHLD